MTSIRERRGWNYWARRLMASVPLVAGIVLLLPIAKRTAAQAPSYSVIYTFTGGADGARPSAGLIADANSNLYGTTSTGGNTSGVCSPYGCGVVFKLDPRGKETVVYTFTVGAASRIC